MIKKDLLVLYGSGGCARSMLPTARETYDKSEIIIVDDNKCKNYINDINVKTFNEILELNKINNLKFVISISDTLIRKEIANKIFKNNLKISSLISSKSIFMDFVEIAEGSLISPFVTIGSNVKIGKFFHANLYSYVEHDCEIGDFVTFAPGVKCNGNVNIQDNVYVGCGAIILQGNKKKKIIIGEGAVIGAGAVVTKDVKPNSTVVGVPAKEI